MTDTDILRKALERYRNATANNTAFKDGCNGHRYKTVNGFVWQFEIKKGC